MRILFANHTSSVSGAELALLRLLSGLATEHQIAVACPGVGPLPAALSEIGVARTTVPAFEASFRPHAVHTPAGIVRLCAGGVALHRTARRFRADVLYANTTRAGLMGVVAQRLGGPPLVVRLHDHLPSTPAGRAVRSLIARSASAVLAVSDYTARRFNDGLAIPIATRVYNCVDHSRFDPARVSPAPLRAELGISDSALLLGQVAQITQWKGQDHAIRTLGALRRAGIDAHLVLIGEIVFDRKRVRYDNPAYLRALHRLVEELRLGEVVHFLGHRKDVPALLRALDLSLLPSREEPFGLAAIESLAMGTPVFVPDAGGAAEIVQDGVTGRVLPLQRPQEWAEAILRTASDRAELERMGLRARTVAARFREETHAREIEAHLERAAAGGQRPSPRARLPIAGTRRPRTKGAQWPN